MKPRSKFRRFMWLAALASLVALILLQTLYANLGGGLLDALRITALTLLYHFAVRLLIGEALIPRIDFSRIDGSKSWFRVRNRELALYRRIGVQRWKSALPTYDPAEFDLQVQGPDGLVRSTCRAGSPTSSTPWRASSRYYLPSASAPSRYSCSPRCSRQSLICCSSPSSATTAPGSCG